MMNYLDIWRAIDRLAEKYNMSPSGLAKRAGLNPTTFNPGKRIGPDGKPRWPNTESIAKILDVTGTNMADFAGLLHRKGQEPETAKAQTVPLLGLAEAGQAGFFDDAGFPVGGGWDEIKLPSTPDDNSYALEVSGNSMEPAYREGDILIISPSAPLRRGDRVVVKTNEGEVMAKELVRMTNTKLDLKSLNPLHNDRSFGLKDVTWVARILWVSQ